MLKHAPGIPIVDMLSLAEEKLESHEVLMRWVEEQRAAIEQELNQGQTTELVAINEDHVLAPKLTQL